MRYKSYLCVIVLLFLGCTNEATAPKLAPRIQRLPVEACYKTELDLRKLNVSSVRNLVTCLNGKEGAIQPYADFLEKTVSDEDLKVILDIYNKHLVKESRFRKVFDFIDHMNKNGLSDDFYKNISYLTQSRSLQTLLPVLSVLYQAEESGVRPVDAINDYIRVFIEQEEINGALISIANLLGSGRSRWLSYVGSKYFTTYPNHAEKVVDDISNGIYQAIQTNGWQEFLLLATDPLVHPILLRLIEGDKGIAAYGGFMKKLFQKQGQKAPFTSLVELSIATSSPILCWEGEALSENLFGSIFDKLAGHSDVASFEAEILQQIPTMYFLGRNSCQFDQRIKTNIQTPIALARDGYGLGMQSTIHSFGLWQRQHYIKQLLTSINIQAASSLLENISQGDIIFYALEVLQKDLSKQDFISFHRIVRNMFIHNIDAQDLLQWINVSDLSLATKEYLAKIVQTHGLSMHSTLDHLVADLDVDESALAYTELILYLSKTEMLEAPGSRLQAMMLKLFGPNYVFRRNLKDFVNTYIDSLANQEAGWGDLIASFGEAVVQTGETPFVDFIKDLISDKDFVTAMNPVLEKFFKDPNFLKSLAFTGELAKNGELRRLINFFVQIAKSIDVPGLEMYPSPYSYIKFRGDLSEFKKDYSYVVQAKNDYSACWDLTGTQTGSDLWLKFIDCTNAKDSYPATADVLRFLKTIPYEDSNAYEALTGIIDSILSKGTTFGFVRALQQSKPQVKGIHSVLYTAFTEHRMLHYLNQILPTFVLHPSFSHFLQKLGTWFTTEGLTSFVHSYIKIFELELSSFYVIPKQFKGGLIDEAGMYALAHSWHKDLDYSHLPIDQQNIEGAWVHAREAFQNRNHDYYYQQGIYNEPPSIDIDKKDFYRSQILEYLTYLNRPGNLEAILKSFQSLQAEGFDYEGFFTWLFSSQKPIKYYSFSAKKPSIRIVSPADQLELLAQNAQIGVAAWMGSLGVEHAATLFQYDIATSSNLKETLNKTKGKISQGLNYEAAFGSRRKWNHLKNLQESFGVLEEMEARGYLRLLQVMYKDLLEVTPEQYKKKQDPILNHMGLAHYLGKMGLLIRIVPGLNILQQQGRLRDFSAMFERVIMAMDAEAQAGLRRSVELLLADNGSRFEVIFDAYWTAVDQSKSNIFSQNILNAHNLVSGESASLAGAMLVFEKLLENKEVLSFVADRLFDSFTDERAVLPRWISNFSYVEDSPNVMQSLLFQPQTLLVEVTDIFKLSYQSQPHEVTSMYEVWLQLLGDPKTDYKTLRSSLSLLLENELREPRTFSFLSNILMDPEIGKVMSYSLYGMAMDGRSEDLMLEYLKFMSVGDFESVLDYLDDFKPTH